jgi:glutamyl-tRNA synthetase
LPEALLNFLMHLGWSHPEGKEFLTLTEFVNDFVIERMQKTGPVFDLAKLNWMNGKYIREVLSPEEVLKRLSPYIPADCSPEMAQALLPLIIERLVRLDEFEQHTSFFYREFELDSALLTKKSDAENVKSQLTETLNVLQSLTVWTTPTIEETLRALQEKHDWKKSQYFMMIRVAVTGQTATPPLFETMEVLGQERTLKRLQNAHDLAR